MAIATEIGRLQGAKQDLISRLKAKGVSVPENATLEEITPLVDNIDAGSGGGSGESNSIYEESVNLTANSKIITINHNLGYVPTHFVYSATTTQSSPANIAMSGWGDSSSGSAVYSTSARYATCIYSDNARCGGDYAQVTETTLVLKPMGTTQYFSRGGYRVFVW